MARLVTVATRLGPAVAMFLIGAAARPCGSSGEPFSAHTAHHHAPIVMKIDKIDPR